MKRQNRILIVGPMTGKKGLNKLSFDRAEEFLREYFTYSEIRNPINTGYSLRIQTGVVTGEDANRLCMTKGLKYICKKATALYMLKGWEDSKGSRAMHATAVYLGLEIIYE